MEQARLNYRQANFVEMRAMLETINWEEGMSEMNVNEAWSFMRDEIKTVMQKPREKKTNKLSTWYDIPAMLERAGLGGSTTILFHILI